MLPLPAIVEVGEVEVEEGEVVTPLFTVNGTLGRAWVTLDIDSPNAQEDDLGRSEKVRVRGLGWDHGTRAIVFVRDDERFVCGPIRQWSGGQETRDGCKLDVRYEQRRVDDGFTVERRRYAVVTLELPG